jgi:hypothetical protein
MHCGLAISTMGADQREAIVQRQATERLIPIIRGSRRFAMQAQGISRVDDGGCCGTLPTRLVVEAEGESGTCHIDSRRAGGD